MERVTLNAAWEITTINALNDLSYIKSKQQHDKQLIEDIKNAIV
jgi:hypothetical protein